MLRNPNPIQIHIRDLVNKAFTPSTYSLIKTNFKYVSIKDFTILNCVVYLSPSMEPSNQQSATMSEEDIEVILDLFHQVTNLSPMIQS